MRLRENFLRRRVARWRAWVINMIERGRFVLARQPTEAEAREKIRAFQAMAAADRMTMPGAEYADLSDLEFAFGLVDETRRQLDFYQKAPTTATPAIDCDLAPQTWVYPYIDPPEPPPPVA